MRSASAPYHPDHVIGETASLPGRRATRAQQRAATRLALVEATMACLAEDGYAALTTRSIAERAGVAQSTLMHHYATREALLVEAVTHAAMQLADNALEEIDLAALRSPKSREAVLDRAWREFTSPEALAAAQLWVAAWSEPELASTLRGLEQRLGAIIVATAGTLFPEESEDPRFLALIDTAVSVIRGLVTAIPISGRASVDERWEAVKPILLHATESVLDTRPDAAG